VSVWKTLKWERVWREVDANEVTIYLKWTRKDGGQARERLRCWKETLVQRKIR